MEKPSGLHTPAQSPTQAVVLPVQTRSKSYDCEQCHETKPEYFYVNKSKRLCKGCIAKAKKDEKISIVDNVDHLNELIVDLRKQLDDLQADYIKKISSLEQGLEVETGKRRTLWTEFDTYRTTNDEKWGAVYGPRTGILQPLPVNTQPPLQKRT